VAKLEGWKEKLLSPAGKEVLVKSVIQAIPNYAMSIIQFPRTFCNTLNSTIAKFWWRTSGKDKGIHWTNWKEIIKNKMDEGLKFRDMRIMNEALLAKQVWRAIRNPEVLWVRVLQAKYFPESSIIRAKKQKKCSWS